MPGDEEMMPGDEEEMPGDETHTLLHCPHFSPLTQRAIHCLMLSLRQFDLWAWATYTDAQTDTQTDTHKVGMRLGSIGSICYSHLSKSESTKT